MFLLLLLCVALWSGDRPINGPADGRHHPHPSMSDTEGQRVCVCVCVCVLVWVSAGVWWEGAQVWRTHHGLLGACRGSIKRERWRDWGLKEMKRERGRKMVKRESFVPKAKWHWCPFERDSLSFLSSFSSICFFLTVLDKLFLPWIIHFEHRTSWSWRISIHKNKCKFTIAVTSSYKCYSRLRHHMLSELQTHRNWILSFIFFSKTPSGS